MHDAVSLVLKVSFAHSVIEPNAESGFARIRALTGVRLDDAILSDAVADCVAEGYVDDPVWLPEGALQCHWHLRLTPKGVAEVQSLLQQSGSK
jgi:hypothetical protein